MCISPLSMVHEDARARSRLDGLPRLQHVEESPECVRGMAVGAHLGEGRPARAQPILAVSKPYAVPAGALKNNFKMRNFLKTFLNKLLILSRTNSLLHQAVEAGGSEESTKASCCCFRMLGLAERPVVHVQVAERRASPADCVACVQAALSATVCGTPSPTGVL